MANAVTGQPIIFCVNPSNILGDIESETGWAIEHVNTGTTGSIVDKVFHSCDESSRETLLVKGVHIMHKFLNS